MKCTDLMIGSLVEVAGKPYVIDSDDLVKLQWGNILEQRRYKPLLITETMLVKAGFEKRNYRLFTFQDFEIHIVNGSFRFRSYNLKEVKYIHQLQQLCKLLLNVDLKFI